MEARPPAPSWAGLDGLALGADGSLFDSTVCYPVGCAGGNNAVDISNQRIRKVDTKGIITTVAGNGQMEFAGDRGPATGASICFPEGVAVDEAGNLYIVDAGNSAIRRVDTKGTITTVSFINGDDGSPNLNLSVEDYRKAGGAVALDAAGNLYIADLLNYRVRKVTPLTTPYFPDSRLVNAASYRGGSVAPGSIVSIFGVNLAADVQSSDSAQLPTQLLDTTLTINNTPAPLFYVSPTQINAQVPFETPSGTVPVEVIRTQTGKARGALAVAEASPGISIIGRLNQGAILTPTGELAAPEGSLQGIATRPARHGEFVSIFLTGLGNVNNPPPTGAPAPGQPPLSESVLNTTVTIGGIAVKPSFSGLAPLLVGVYQVNVQVPDTVPSGMPQVTVSVGGAVSNTVIMAVD
jgi:uncharacterized protein (TIGR03437 family)